MLTFQRLVAARLIVMQITIFLLGLLHGQVVGYDLFEGNACNLKDGSEGVCTKLPECQTLYDGLIHRTIPYSSIVRCSFIGMTEVVCCGDRKPDVTEKMTTNTVSPGGIIFPTTTPKVIKQTGKQFGILSEKEGTTSFSNQERNFDISSIENNIRSVLPHQHAQQLPEQNILINGKKSPEEKQTSNNDNQDSRPNIDERFFLNLPQKLPLCNFIYDYGTTTPTPTISVGPRFGLGLGIFTRRNSAPTTRQPSSSPLSSFVDLIKPIKTIPIKIISSITNPSRTTVSGQVNQNNIGIETVVPNNVISQPCIYETPQGPQVILTQSIPLSHIQNQGAGASTLGIIEGQQSSVGNSFNNWNNQEVRPTFSSSGSQQINPTTYIPEVRPIASTTYTPALSNTPPWPSEIFIATTMPTTTTTSTAPTSTTLTKSPIFDYPIWEQWTEDSIENYVTTSTTPHYINSRKQQSTTPTTTTYKYSELISGTADSLPANEHISAINDNPVLDTWMKEALLSKASTPKAATSNVSTREIPTTTKSPILDNPVLDPWMKEALMVPSAHTTSSRKNEPKSETSSSNFHNPASNPWMQETLLTSPSTHKMSALKNLPSNPVMDVNAPPLDDNPVLDTWMKEALAITVTEQESNTSRITKDIEEHPVNFPATKLPGKTVTTTNSPILENPVLDPWMKDALLKTSNSDGSGVNSIVNPVPSTKQLQEREQTSHGNSRSEQAQVPSVTSKLPNQPNKSVLDPWMQQVLEEVDRTTTTTTTVRSAPINSGLNPLITGGRLIVSNSSNPFTTDNMAESPWKRESPLSTTINGPGNIQSIDVEEQLQPAALGVGAILTASPSKNSSYYPDYNEISRSTGNSGKFPDPGTTRPDTSRFGAEAERACARYKQIKVDTLPSLTFHILGGSNTSLGEFPHMAALGYPSQAAGRNIDWNCGGTLISENFVMTAAHCITSEGPTMIRLGKITIDSNLDQADPVDAGITEIILHPRYTTSRQYDDIALIKLNRTLEFTEYVHPACLNTDRNDLPPDSNVVVTGWGTIAVRSNIKSSILLKANLTTVDLMRCNQSHNEYSRSRKLPQGLNEGHLCAYDPGLVRDTCEGDSGGPLQVKDQSGIYIIYGVTSFGVSCASMIPAVYARVSYYMDWIESIVWP